MRLDSWRSLAGMAQTAWFQSAAWCVLNFSPAGTGGVSAALWAVTGALLLRLTTLAAPGSALIARLTGLPRT